MLTTVLTFVVAAVLIILLPGPDTMVVVRSLLRDGRRQAALTVAGVTTGLGVWVSCAALGLAAVLRASETGYAALRVAGGCYLGWLGVQSLRAKPTGAPRSGLLGTGYTAGLATNLLNPKVGVFFLTFLPGFIPAGSSVGAVSLLLGGIFISLNTAYFALLLVLATRVTGWLNDARVRRRLDRVTGVVLIGFGIRLATEP